MSRALSRINGGLSDAIRKLTTRYKRFSRLDQV